MRWRAASSNNLTLSSSSNLAFSLLSISLLTCRSCLRSSLSPRVALWEDLCFAVPAEGLAPLLRGMLAEGPTLLLSSIAGLEGPRWSCQRRSLWSTPWSSLAVAHRSSAMRTAAESHPWGSTSTTAVSWSRSARWRRRGRKGPIGFVAASVVLRHCFGCCASHHFRLHQSNRRVVGQGVQVAEVNEEEPRPISHQSSFAVPSFGWRLYGSSSWAVGYRTTVRPRVERTADNRDWVPVFTHSVSFRVLD